MNRPKPPLALILLVLPVHAGAVLLDCEISAERIYTCVEVGAPTTGAPAPGGAETYSDEYRGYIGQARQECVYQEPPRRPARKTSGGGAQRMEELKSAREEYERCVTDTARRLWHSQHPGGASGREPQQ